MHNSIKSEPVTGAPHSVPPAVESSVDNRLFRLPAPYGVLLMLLLTFGSLMPIWATVHFPSQNGPWNLLQTHMMKEFDNSAWDYSSYYNPNWHPKPHMLHNLLVLSLSYGFPLLLAEKIALSVYAILLPLSIFYFLKVVAPRNTLLVLLAYLMVHSYVFYRGYHNFALSLPLFFTTFAFWYQHRNNISWKHAIALSLLACLTWLSHLFTFLFLTCAIGYFRLIETRQFRPAIVSVLTVTWLGWILSFDHVLLIRGNATWVVPEDTSFLKPHESVEYFVRKMFYSTSLTAYALSVAAWLWIVVLLISEVLTLRKGGEFRRSLFSRPSLVLLITVSAAYFLVPYKVLGWHYVNVRLVPFILGFALASAAPMCDMRFARFTRLAFVVTTSIAALTVDVLLTMKVVEMEQSVRECISGVEEFGGNTKLLPVLTENEAFGQIRPITRCHEYYHIEKGGANGYGIAAVANTHVCMWLRSYPPTTMFPRFDPDNPEESMGRIRDTYGYVLLWGDSDEWVRRLQGHGFSMVHHEGRLRLYQNDSDGPRNHRRHPPETGHQ